MNYDEIIDKNLKASAAMTLRDYFAVKAMQGFLSDPSVEVKNDLRARLLAKSAYGIADAMLAERAK